jgi:hypothetical protein
VSKKPRMTRVQISRLPRLLHMRYSPSEIASEIGCTTEQIYKSYLPAQCPHERDATGHIWIVGDRFREWALRTFKHQVSHEMAEDEAFCLRCRKPVKIIQPVIRPTNRYLELIQGKCAECGAKVNRGRKKSD